MHRLMVAAEQLRGCWQQTDWCEVLPGRLVRHAADMVAAPWSSTWPCVFTMQGCRLHRATAVGTAGGSICALLCGAPTILKGSFLNCGGMPLLVGGLAALRCCELLFCLDCSRQARAASSMGPEGQGS